VLFFCLFLKDVLFLNETDLNPYSMRQHHRTFLNINIKNNSQVQPYFFKVVVSHLIAFFFYKKNIEYFHKISYTMLKHNIYSHTKLYTTTRTKLSNILSLKYFLGFYSIIEANHVPCIASLISKQISSIRQGKKV